MRSLSPSLHLLPLSPPIPLFRALLSPSLPPSLSLSLSLTLSLSFSPSQIFPLRSSLLFLPSFFHNLCLVPRVPPLLTPLSLLLDPWHIHSPGRSSPSSEPREPVRVWSPRLKNAAVYPLRYRTRGSFSKSYRNCNEKLDGRSRQLTRQQLMCTWTYNVFQRVVGTWGTSLFVFSEGALACNSIWTNAATSLYAGYFPDGSLPAGGRLKNVRWRRGEEKQWGRLCSTGETRREKLDVPLEAEASIFFQVSSSMRDLGDRLFFLCPFVSANGDGGGRKKDNNNG